jgi:hypothetical protein
MSSSIIYPLNLHRGGNHEYAGISQTGGQFKGTPE